MQDYLVAKCVERDGSLFRRERTIPGESEVLEAIGWTPSERSEEKNWEDEQWEREQVKEDLRKVMRNRSPALPSCHNLHFPAEPLRVPQIALFLDRSAYHQHPIP